MVIVARSHVTKREAQAICDYAADLAGLLNMPGWRILVMEEPTQDDDEAYATIDWIDQKHTAQLRLCPSWMKLDDATRRECITHEVLHLLHARVSTVALDDAAVYMRDHDHRDWSRRVRREFELMVDHLATFMSRTFKLEEAWDRAHGRTS
ncbi:hypothetical protein QWY28_17300 [Nocardioides sp. SOB77]|uniref:ImmA/IrrE family metallo-endopeptidase n=1 Tax=Nocardioides oceani TaxID=3058369 RepID=A0ABT8FJ73_9ACTN|nr:hypothetical protein [Nocardioides oceani]MDN4174721.1 hypothetical protein [Nocardioides oceani]